MTTAKIQPPRKLTEEEDLDSFDDWWFQCVSYFGRDANFKSFLKLMISLGNQKQSLIGFRNTSSSCQSYLLIESFCNVGSWSLYQD